MHSIVVTCKNTRQRQEERERERGGGGVQRERRRQTDTQRDRLCLAVTDKGMHVFVEQGL